jgi:hypothetical protein
MFLKKRRCKLDKEKNNLASALCTLQLFVQILFTPVHQKLGQFTKEKS